MRWFIVLVFLLSGCVGDDPVKIAKEAQVKGNMSICEKIDDYRMRYNCSVVVAVSEDNTSMCESVDSLEWMEDCYINIGVRRKDMGLCDFIQRDGKKQTCYRKIAGSMQS